MDKKICSECGVANENDYIYCKNCGAPLVKTEAEPEFIGNNAQSETKSGGDFDRGTDAGGLLRPTARRITQVRSIRPITPIPLMR